MRSGARAWIVVVALFLLHFILHVGLGLGPVAPDLLTVALLVAAREVGMGTAAATGFFFGLLEDALSVLSFGANTLAMTLVGGLGALTRELFVGDSLVFLLSYFMVGKWVRDLVHWLMVGEALRRPFFDQVVVQGAIGSVYAAVVGILVMAIAGLWREAQQ